MDIIKPDSTIAGALESASAFLSGSGVPEAKAQAGYLLSHALGVKRHELFLESGKKLSPSAAELFEGYIKRRASREPSQYITGITEFRGLPIKVTRDTLIPRPETELLVDEVIRLAPLVTKGRVIVIDLCTGSGCIAAAIAKELRNCVVFATDISREALKIAHENAKLNEVDDRIEFLPGDLFEPLVRFRNRAAIIVSNPPYVAEEDFFKLPPEIKDHEPAKALYGGEDGLHFYREILKDAHKHLLNNGFIILEAGYGQAEKITAIANRHLFPEMEIKKDLSGIDRVVIAKYRECTHHHHGHGH